MNKKVKELLNELKLDINTINSNENEIDTQILISVENVKLLLKYIDKLQERLNFRVRYCNELEHELYECGNYIHKEKIRNKIKELEENSSTVSVFKIDVLKELLGE